MKINQEMILDFLAQKNDWTESSCLATQFGVSSRTIRNYIRNINSSYGSEMIISSYKGYKIDKEGYRLTKNEDKGLKKTLFETPDQRVFYIIQKLLSSLGKVDIYSL